MSEKLSQIAVNCENCGENCEHCGKLRILQKIAEIAEKLKKIADIADCNPPLVMVSLVKRTILTRNNHLTLPLPFV